MVVKLSGRAIKWGLCWNWGVVQERPDGTFRPMSMSETLALNQGGLFPKQSLLDEL